MTASNWLRAFALAALLTAACTDDDNADDDNDPTGPPPPGPPPPAPIASFLVTAVLDATGGVVRVTDNSVPVAGATVRLNGITGTPGAEAGEYELSLPVAVAAGGGMTLEVRQGESLVRSIGRVPEPPVVTAPADASVIDPTVPVQIEWASATYPSRFEVVAIGGTTLTFPVAGSSAARARVLPAGSLARGDWSLRVDAINRATMTGNEEPYSFMEIRSGGTAPRSFKIAPLPLIQGEMGKSAQTVHLTLDGMPLNGATVTVNGAAATQAALDEPYVARLALPLAVGDRVDLSVTVGPEVYTATGSVPPGPPVITAMGGSVSSPVNPRWVEWSSPDGVGRFTVTGGPCYGQPQVNADVGGNQRRYTFAQYALPFTHQVTVKSYGDGSFTGVVRPDSRMGIVGGVDHHFAGQCD